MGKIETELKKSGAIVYAISNEGPSDLREMKDAEKLGSTFVFLSDIKADAAAGYAGHYAGKTMLNPATFVIGKSGKIIYAYVGEDYKERADSQLVLQMVKKASK